MGVIRDEKPAQHTWCQLPCQSLALLTLLANAKKTGCGQRARAAGSAWMQQDQALQQHGSAGKNEGPAFSHGAWQVAAYCSYFDMCLCLQLYSAPHFAFKCRVQLLLLLVIKPGAPVCAASVALCSCFKLAIKPTELHQLPLLLALRGAQGGWGTWWSSLDLGMALTATGKCCLPQSLTLVLQVCCP